jgi:hypothetical protein
MKAHASEHPGNAIFASMHPVTLRHCANQAFGEWDHDVDFVVTHDFFATHRVLVPRGNRFLFSERYLSVAQVRGRRGATRGSGGAGQHLSVATAVEVQSLLTTPTPTHCLSHPQVMDPMECPHNVASDVVLQVGPRS